MTQATLFVAFEDMGYDGHFIDEDSSKIFTTREAAEAYGNSKYEARVQEFREWVSGLDEAELLKKMNRYQLSSEKQYSVDELEDYLAEEAPRDNWTVEELEFVN